MGADRKMVEAVVVSGRVVVVVVDVVTVVTDVMVRVTGCCGAGGIAANMGWAFRTTAVCVRGLSFLL